MANLALTSQQPRFLRRCLPFALAWLWAFGCHGLIVLMFSHSLPVADQWDSEGFVLMRPWLEGTLTWQDLFSAHNEHRIVTKRLLDLIVLTLNGQHWDNLVITLINAAIYAAAVAVLFSFVTRATEGSTRRVLQACALVLPLLQSNYENTLWGFQSPFYFYCLFALLAFRHAALHPHLPRWGATLLACSIAAQLSLGSGLLLPATLAVLVLLDQRGASPGGRRTAVIAALLAVAAVGYLFLPHLPPGNTVMARSVTEAALGALRMAAWPLQLWPLAWLPLLLWLPFRLRQRRAFDAAELFFLAIAGWVALQALATGYGRGHGMLSIAWRYTDSLVYGLVANVFFSCQLLQWLRSRLPPWPLRLAWTGVAVLWLVAGSHLALASMQGFFLVLRTHQTWQARQLVTAALLRSDPVAEDNFALPYPHLSKMPLFLGSPTMRALLGIRGTQLPAPCDVPAQARLSRAVCAVRRMLPEFGLPGFQKVPAPAGDGETSRCNVDYLGGLSRDGIVLRGSPLRLDSWVGPPERPRRLMLNEVSVLLVADAVWYRASTRLTLPRPDVAAFTADPRYYWSGLYLVTSTEQVEPGTYELVLQATGSQPCRTGRMLTVQ